MSKQTDSYTVTFPSLTAPSGEECDTGLQAAKGYTLMILLSWQQIGQRRSEDFCVKHLTIICLDPTLFRSDINKCPKVSEIHLYTIDSKEAEPITNDVPERSYV